MKAIIFLASLAVCLSVTWAVTCEDNDDCDDDQCCVARVRRQMEGEGVCMRKGKLNARCSQKEYGGKYMALCPCKDKLECKPRGLKTGDEDNKTKYNRSLRCQKEKKLKSSTANPSTDSSKDGSSKQPEENSSPASVNTEASKETEASPSPSSASESPSPSSASESPSPASVTE